MVVDFLSWDSEERGKLFLCNLFLIDFLGLGLFKLFISIGNNLLEKVFVLGRFSSNLFVLSIISLRGREYHTIRFSKLLVLGGLLGF